MLFVGLGRWGLGRGGFVFAREGRGVGKGGQGFGW